MLTAFRIFHRHDFGLNPQCNSRCKCGATKGHSFKTVGDKRTCAVCTLTEYLHTTTVTCSHCNGDYIAAYREWDCTWCKWGRETIMTWLSYPPKTADSESPVAERPTASPAPR